MQALHSSVFTAVHFPTVVGSGRLALVVAVLAIWLPGRWHSPVRSAPPLSLAVMAFTAPGGDAADGRFAASLAQDVTTGLSRWRWTTVASGREIASHGGQDLDARAIGRKLNVRYIVEGQVRSVGERRVIHASLVSADTGTNVWSDQLEFDASGSQHALAARLYTRLRNAIYEAEMRRASTNPVPGSAWDLVLRGDAVFMQERMTDPVKAIHASQKFYDEALRIDPNFVPALGTVALSVFTLIENDLTANRSKYERELDESERLTARAVSADSRDTFRVVRPICRTRCAWAAGRGDGREHESGGSRSVELHVRRSPRRYRDGE